MLHEISGNRRRVDDLVSCKEIQEKKVDREWAFPARLNDGEAVWKTGLAERDVVSESWSPPAATHH